MKQFIFVVVALSVVAPCAAQDSTTRCTQWRNTVNCNTSTLDAPPASDGSFERGMDDLGNAIRARRERRDEQKRQQAATQLAQQQAGVRAEVVGRLKAGDCVGAERVALDGGDIQLAGQVRSYCSASPKP